MPVSNRPPAPWITGGTVVLTIAAPFMAGSTKLWAKAAMALTLGFLFLLAPPRRSLGRPFNLVFAALAFLPLIGFLPARLFPMPGWRTTLVALGIQLPATWSAQPWLTIESACVFWLGLAWGYYLFAHDWDATDSREAAWDGYCLGILALSALLVTSYALKWRVPFWPNVPEFGFFPNRNQTSDVLGLGGIMTYANAFQNIERGRRRGWLWLGGLALICWALILNYSRAGIVLFFVGALIWHVWWLFRTDADQSIPRAIAWGPLVILLALLLLAGGETLIRFKQSADFHSTAENGRLLIQRDAFNLFKISPVLGTGLGNFRSLFSAHHYFFISDSEAIHPESDWLWFGVETGIFGPLLILAGFVTWMTYCLPFSSGTWRGMRSAALICGIAFVVHGAFDVSGHRIGALWPALLLAATAINPRKIGPSGRLPALIFRGAGAGFTIVASWWFASIFTAQGPPTSVTVQRLIDRSSAATATKDYGQLLGLTESGLKVAPLDWVFYYNRALAEAVLDRPDNEVRRDLTVARFLMPNWPGLYLREGELLLSASEPDAAFDIWKEGMERLSVPWEFYSNIYPLVKDDADLRERWRELGKPNKRCVLIFLQNATPTEFQIELNRITTEDPELREFASPELKRLFELWYQRGEKLALAETLLAHPDWEKIGWRELARALADNQDYHQAYDTVVRFAPTQLPELSPNDSVESLATRFRVSESETDGLQLALAESARGQTDDALAVITVLAGRPRSSPLVSYAEARLQAEKREWAKAWQAVWHYVERAKL